MYSLVIEKNVHKNVKCSRFECPYCKDIKSLGKKSLNVQNKRISDKPAYSQFTLGYLWDAVGITMPNS